MPLKNQKRQRKHALIFAQQYESQHDDTAVVFNLVQVASGPSMGVSELVV